MNSAFISLLFVLALCGTASGQDMILEPVLGQIQMDNDGIWSCQITGSQLCTSCVEDADTPAPNPPLIIAFGTTGLFGWSYGTLSGTIQLALEVDGLTIPPALLPCNSYFTSRIGVGMGFVPNSPCGTQGLDYQINSNIGSFTEGGNHEITIPAEEADLVCFEINFCSVSAHWGAGCNVGGSFNDRWVLHAPGLLNAALVDPGDSGPLSFPTQGVTLDFAQGGGGLVTVLRSELDAPGGSAPSGPSGSWEIRTDMPDGSYSAMVTLEFDPLALPAEIDPAGLMIARYDRAADRWDILASTVDVLAGTVTATTDGLSKFVLAAENVVGVTTTTWGAIKAKY
jgi:hypothetical protein